MNTTTTTASFTSPSYAKRIRRMMRENGITIKAFAKHCGVTQDRIRELRNTGRAQWRWEWVESLREMAQAKAV